MNLQSIGGWRLSETDESNGQATDVDIVAASVAPCALESSHLKLRLDMSTSMRHWRLLLVGDMATAICVMAVMTLIIGWHEQGLTMWLLLCRTGLDLEPSHSSPMVGLRITLLSDATNTLKTQVPSLWVSLPIYRKRDLGHAGLLLRTPIDKNH